MVERRQYRRFALKPAEALRIIGNGLGQHLDRDITIEARISRAIHLAHPPCT